MSEKGTLYFFTGLVGAGKTTLGGLFRQRLIAAGHNVVILDGDQMRTAFGHTGYSPEERIQGAMERLLPLCRLLTDQSVDVVACSVCMYRVIRDWYRAHVENYREIYVKASWETLYRRDQKKLYSSGAKQMVGIDLPWDEPEHADIVIENDGRETPEEIVDRLERFFGIAGEAAEKAGSKI